MTSRRICHRHGDTFAACKGLPHGSLWCDGQGAAGMGTSSRYGVCRSCNKVVRLRKNGTIRAHNGVGR